MRRHQPDEGDRAANGNGGETDTTTVQIDVQVTRETPTPAEAAFLRPSMTSVSGRASAISTTSIPCATAPGYQLFQAANNTAVLADAPTDRRGTISGLLSLPRNVGLIAGASVMGAVFTFGTGTERLAHTAPLQLPTACC